MPIGLACLFFLCLFSLIFGYCHTISFVSVDLFRLLSIYCVACSNVHISTHKILAMFYWYIQFFVGVAPSDCTTILFFSLVCPFLCVFAQFCQFLFSVPNRATLSQAHVMHGHFLFLFHSIIPFYWWISRSGLLVFHFNHFLATRMIVDVCLINFPLFWCCCCCRNVVNEKLISFHRIFAISKIELSKA